MNRLPPSPLSKVPLDGPPDRDRVVDAVRALALLVTVVAHGVMAVVAWPGGRPVVGNLLAAYPWTQLLTWVLQVMPLFFWAGGAANAYSWERHGAHGGRWATWLWRRAERLLRPLWWYLVIMGMVAGIVTVLAPARVAEPLLVLVTQLLWFLGIYLLLTALTPIFCKPGLGMAAAASLLAACALVDAARFAWHAPAALALVNFVLVWAVPTYVGALHAQGVSRRLPWHRLPLVLVAALSLNAVLVHWGPYPVSMVGLPGDAVSNMAPPTLVLALHSVVLTCIVTLAAPVMQRMLQHAPLRRRVAGINLVTMTLYLWHLPVLVALSTIVHTLGWERPTVMAASGYPLPGGIGYLVGSVPFMLVFALLVWLVVRLLWPLEHMPLPWWDTSPSGGAPSSRIANAVVALSSMGVGISTLMLSAAGLGGFPTSIVTYAGLPISASGAMLLLVASGTLLRWAGAERTVQSGPS